MKKTYLNWSSGKDAAYSLFLLKKEPAYSVEGLLTSVNTHYQRVTMHGVRISLLEKQANALRIPLIQMELPESPSMEIYEETMRDTVLRLKHDGFEISSFGDIYLEDLKAYRDNLLSPLGIQTHYPLWKKDTRLLAHEILDKGFKARVVALDGSKIDSEMAGTEYDEYFLKHLPDNVDPCGENGEFHTFCYDGPIFDKPIKIKATEIIERNYKSPTDEGATISVWFADLIPD